MFTALRRVYPEIFYHKTRTGREVDFIVTPRGQPPRLVQVCESLADAPTRKRETLALSEAMGELGVCSGIIVTHNEEERIDTERGLIEVLPAWRFLLNPAAATT